MYLMLFTVAMFTLTSINDKYAVSKCGYNGSQLTFIMAAFSALFLTPFLFTPLVDKTFTLSPVTFLCIGIMVLAKWCEFAMNAKILTQMSVFELKAWMGLTLFISYFYDVAAGVQRLSALKIGFIVLSALGLIIIASEGKQKVNYKAIAIPLVIYIGQSFAYGYAVRISAGHISSEIALYIALIILALLLIPSAKPLKLTQNREGMKGFLITAGVKLPNAAGLIAYNAVARESMTNYAFVMPMCLITIFVIDILNKNEKLSPTRLAGSILVVAGIVGSQLV
ncbi:MAG: hypothetical protein IJ080_02290 [Oscillospiraceae bacterium]|nr:hypothetical protein [Oscillospiraceae bacterium]